MNLPPETLGFRCGGSSPPFSFRAPPHGLNASSPAPGMLTPFPSPPPLGLGLGAGCPGAHEPASGTRRLSVWGTPPPIVAYSCRHPHSPPLHRDNGGEDP